MQLDFPENRDPRDPKFSNADNLKKRDNPAICERNLDRTSEMPRHAAPKE